MKLYKLVVYASVANADQIRELLGKLGAGKIGNYDYTSFSVTGTGRFRPLKGANPTIGSVGKLEEVPEERIETIVSGEILNDVVAKVRAAHPYEEPAIDACELKGL